jgi:hypothetical protein
MGGPGWARVRTQGQGHQGNTHRATGPPGTGTGPGPHRVTRARDRATQGQGQGQARTRARVHTGTGPGPQGQARQGPVPGRSPAPEWRVFRLSKNNNTQYNPYRKGIIPGHKRPGDIGVFGHLAALPRKKGRNLGQNPSQRARCLGKKGTYAVICNPYYQ